MNELMQNNNEQNSIVPSSDKKELLGQLYFFRSILGNLYLSAKDKEDSDKRMASANAVYNNLVSERQLAKSAIVAKMIANEERRKAKRLFMIGCLSLVLITIVLGLTLSFILDYSFVPIAWVGIPCLFIAFVLTYFYSKKIKDIAKIEDDWNYKNFSDVLNASEEERTAFFNGIKSKLLSVEKKCDSAKYEEKISDYVKKISDFVKNNRTDLFLDQFPYKYVALKDKIDEAKKRLEFECEQNQKLTTIFKNKFGIVACNFAHFLVRADWGMVDVLLHMISSGRADSLKEALNLGDLKIRHDAIVKSINDLNGTIKLGYCTISKQLIDTQYMIANLSNNISKSMFGLREAINESSASIRKTLNFNSNQMLEKIDNVYYGVI